MGQGSGEEGRLQQGAKLGRANREGQPLSEYARTRAHTPCHTVRIPSITPTHPCSHTAMPMLQLGEVVKGEGVGEGVEALGVGGGGKGR
jgi:hypothetical protein